MNLGLVKEDNLLLFISIRLLYHKTIKAHAAIPKVVRKDPCRRRVAA